MISALIRRLTGRSYAIGRGDLGYLFAKGARPAMRGAVWSLLRARRPQGLLLGPGISFIMAGRLRAARGVSIGGYSYVDCSAEHGVVLAERVTIREGAWIQGRSGLNAPAEGLWIGTGTYIGPRAVLGIGGPIRIGAGVQVGAGLTISAESHVPGSDGTFVSGEVSRRGVRVGDRCWLGNNVTLLDGVEVGEGCVIGAGAVVTRSLPPFSLAVGVPAAIVRSIAPSG